MVNLDHLAALDLLVWLGTTERAAVLANTNQSTISRRSRVALQTFRLEIGRSVDGRRPRGDTSFLMLERQVHQRARFLGKQPLRLQVPDWSRERVLRRPPEGWCTNPPLPGLVCHDPVALLRERVIDACLVTPTQLPAQADDLLLLDLYRRPIELTLLASAHRQASRSLGSPSLHRGGLHLDLLPFLPRSCQVRSREWFAALEGSTLPAADRARRLSCRTAGEDALRVAFLTPEMREIQERPSWVVDGVEPYPYVERLAVLAENATEPALQRLQDQLLGQFTTIPA